MTPVFIFNGFLESGKTDFLTQTVRQPYFQMQETTLLIVCEEGESKYDVTEFEKYNTIVKYIDNEGEFTAAMLMNLDSQYKPQRILIEWNGMWDYKNMILPFHWEIKQQITTIDARNYELFYNNMRSIMMEMLKKSELIIFNRCDSVSEKLGEFKRNVKLVNKAAIIAFEGEKGEIKVSLEEDLPYDLNRETIHLSDSDYVAWYMDCMESLQRYEGKKMNYIARILKNKYIPNGYMLVGRQVMTCCADDLAFAGFPCRYKNATDFQDGEWVNITVRISVRKCFAYSNGNGPVLSVESITKTKQPTQSIIGG